MIDINNNEADLIKQVQAGNNNAFASLYDKYIKKIYDFCYYKTLNKELAEDLTSQVFIKALKNINNFDGQYFQAWLYTIARNAITDYYRSKKEMISIDDVWDVVDKSELLVDVDNRWQVEKVFLAMSKLKSSERDLLIMRLWQGLSYEEIALETGKTVGSLKMSFSRALIKIKAEVPITLFLFFSLIYK